MHFINDCWNNIKIFFNDKNYDTDPEAYAHIAEKYDKDYGSSSDSGDILQIMNIYMTNLNAKISLQIKTIILNKNVSILYFF